MRESERKATVVSRSPQILNFELVPKKSRVCHDVYILGYLKAKNFLFFRLTFDNLCKQKKNCTLGTGE